MSESIAITIMGIDPKKIEAMICEIKTPSKEQKVAEELYSLRERNALLEQQLQLVKHDREILKHAVELGISIIVTTAYEAVNEKGKEKLDGYKKDIGKVLRTSDLIGMLIGEE